MPMKRWTQNEEEFLRRNYSLKGSRYVASALGRTRASVLRHALSLGLDGTGNLPYRPFSPREVIFLKTHYPLKGSAYVAAKLGRSPKSIRLKARALRVERQSLLRWSPSEIEIVKRWYNKKRPSQIARRLGRTTSAVCVRARMLGLCRHRIRAWTDAEERFLRENFRTMRYKQIAERLGRTVGSVTGKLHVGLKLKKWSKHRWTAADKRKLAYWYRKLPTQLVAAKLDLKSREAVRRMAHFLKLTKPQPPPYSKRNKEFLRKHYLTMTNPELARRLNRSVGSIEAMAKKLGLTRNPLKTKIYHASLRRDNAGKFRKQVNHRS